MVKSLIILLIFVSISSKEILSSTVIEYDEMIEFDKENNQFNFEFIEDNTYFLISIDTKDILDYEIVCNSQSTIKGNVVGEVNAYFIIKAQYAGSCKIKFKQDSEIFDMSGKFSVHQMKKEIPIDFKKQKKYSVGFIVKINDKNCPILTYSISNSTENYDIYLSYSNSKIVVDGKSHTLSNPFKVCQENECVENIKTYKVEKEKNYKIFIKFEEFNTESETVYAFPGFKISDSAFGIRLSFIFLVLLLLF